MDVKELRFLPKALHFSPAESFVSFGAERKINLLRTENRLAQNGESFSGENFVNHKSLYHSVLLMEILLGFYSKKY